MRAQLALTCGRGDMQPKIRRGFTTNSTPDMREAQKAVRRLFKAEKPGCYCRDDYQCAGCELWAAVGQPMHARPIAIVRR